MAGSQPISVWCNNTAAHQLAGDRGVKTRSKHITIRYNNVREAGSSGFIELKHCASENNIADVFTKCFQEERFVRFRDALNLMLTD